MLAKAVGGRLSVLNVGGSLSADEMKELARVVGNVGDALDALSDQVLVHAKQCAERAGVPDVRIHSGWCDPAEVIIETVRRQQADAVVMGRRGRLRLTGFAPRQRVAKGCEPGSVCRDPGSMMRTTEACGQAPVAAGWKAGESAATAARTALHARQEKECRRNQPVP